MADESQDQSPGLVTPEEMQEAIDSSGYLLEGRIGRVLQERGFFVETESFSVSSNPNDGDKTLLKLMFRAITSSRSIKTIRAPPLPRS